MFEPLKQWFTSKTPVIIHIIGGRHRLITKRKFTVGYGAVNTWNLDSEKPPANLLNFRKTKTRLEIEPTNPNDTLLLDGNPWASEVLEAETEYTLQVQDEQLLLCLTAKPNAWLKRINLKRWQVLNLKREKYLVRWTNCNSSPGSSLNLRIQTS